ncbi:hypothetical protein OOK41_31400 [Micromonospora sp. NBC_01655]|uniref:hypothetical protein n=1 Tax=Micromonospora sp. NBC_01655 TaxID=2975983 RepID=UPI00225A7BE8|nr:hypothetical protein [Micromonospora sp. NBC_01655]MCX4474767.1 hypothetical protein [Micromonospora sp. NBC_01655]
MLSLDDPARLVHVLRSIWRGVALAERRIRGGAGVLAELGVELTAFEDIIPAAQRRVCDWNCRQGAGAERSGWAAAVGRPVLCEVLIKSGHLHELRYRCSVA